MHKETYAHSNGTETANWQLLSEHLQNVADLCSSFAMAFDSYEAGRLIGWFHDLGKARSSTTLGAGSLAPLQTSNLTARRTARSVPDRFCKIHTNTTKLGWSLWK